MDQYDDAGRTQLHGFDKVLELPDFVKTASESDPADLKGLQSYCFADPANRKFPVHTRHDAWLSRLYFAKNKSMYKRASEAAIVEEGLKKAAEYWSLEGDYEVKPIMEKQAAPMTKVAINNYQGDKIDEWELRSPRDFEKAAIQIFENKNMFTYPQRKAAARAILGSGEMLKGAKLAPAVHEYLEKAAGYGLSTLPVVLEELRKRAALYQGMSMGFADRVADLADKLTAANDVTPALLGKVAEVLDVCDKHLGLFPSYKRGLATPEEALFQMTEKTACEQANSLVRLTNGKVLAIEKLSEAALDNYFDNVMGENPGGTYEEKLAAVRALPRPDADDLVKFVERV